MSSASPEGAAGSISPRPGFARQRQAFAFLDQELQVTKDGQFGFTRLVDFGEIFCADGRVGH